MEPSSSWACTWLGVSKDERSSQRRGPDFSRPLARLLWFVSVPRPRQRSRHPLSLGFVMTPDLLIAVSLLRLRSYTHPKITPSSKPKPGAPIFAQVMPRPRHTKPLPTQIPFSTRLLAVVPTVVVIPAPGIRSCGRSPSLWQFFAGHTLSPSISLSGGGRAGQEALKDAARKAIIAAPYAGSMTNCPWSNIPLFLALGYSCRVTERTEVPNGDVLDLLRSQLRRGGASPLPR